MEIKYVRIDTSDGYHTSVAEFKNEADMLADMQHRNLSDVVVYEVARRVKFVMQPAVVVADAS